MFALDLPIVGLLPTVGVSLAATSPGLWTSPFVFFTTGYGGSMAASATLGPSNISLSGAVHNVLLALFGARLATFLHVRSRSDSYLAREDVKSRKIQMNSMALKKRVMMWIPCASLYVFMAAPAYATLAASKATKLTDPVFFAGVLAMATAGTIEAVADQQKMALKQKDAKDFASTGVFQICRHPAYFGEILFWMGNMLAGLPAMGLDWRFQLISATGLFGIYGIMSGASKRLVTRQEEKYGTREDWKKYTSKVTGALFPKLI